MKTLIALLLSFTSFAQIATGDWRLHIPNKNCLDVVVSQNIVYGAFENALLEYDIDAKESSTWDYVHHLSDIKISCLGVSDIDHSVFIGYENGNIDKLKNNTVTNIPAIKLSQIIGDKKITRLVYNNKFIYAATGFGIVKIDPLKNEIKDTYYPTQNNKLIQDIAFRNDTLFALTETKLLFCSLSNPAISDYSQWKTDTRVPVLTQHKYKDIETIQNNLYLLFKNDAYGLDTVYSIKTNGLDVASVTTNNLEINSISNHFGKLAVNLRGGFYVFNLDHSIDNIAYRYSFSNELNINQSFAYNGAIWIADSQNGLVRFHDNWNNEKINLVGPPKNSFYSMDYFKGKMVFTGGGLSGKGITYNPAGIYTFEDETWNYYDRYNMNLWKNKYIWDFLTVAVNPLNEDIAVGTFSNIPLSILQKNAQVTDTFTPYNSPITTSSPTGKMSFISATKYDKKGNLWLVNGYANEPLKVYSADKIWTSFNLGSAAMNKFTSKLIIDENGIKWMAIEGVGLIAYNDNGTLTDKSDDKMKILNSGSTTGALPSNFISAIAADLNNNIWIGTDNGFAILYNSSSIFDASPGNYNAQRIKLEYDGNVEYLLGNTFITDIEIDGANRKWIATNNTGLFLLSSDGLEIVKHFTIDNSPLISNSLMDIQMNQSTGELFIITDKGLISFRSDASEGMNDYSSVTVFPNPAKPDFNGLITIQGIKGDSDIKITDSAGNLVYKTASNGGTATWNGKTVEGERVKGGVYLIWTAPNEEKGRKVGKVVVIN